MSQDFEFTEQNPPHPPVQPVETTPPVSPVKVAPVARPAPVSPDPLYRSPFSIGTGLLFVLALSGGLGYLGYDSYLKAPADSSTPGAANTPPMTPANGETPAPSPSPGAEPAHAIAAQVEELKASLKAATARIDELAAKPAPGLKPLEEKIAEVAKTSEAVADVPAKLTALDQKVGAMRKADPSGEAKVDAVDKRVGELASAIDALKAEVAAMARSTTNKPATPADSARADDGAKSAKDVNEADQAMSQGADLFKQRKYAESLKIFTKLQADHPEDARVWYYSALANGLTTNNWVGETQRLVTLGVEKEKAGSPETSKIDAVFAGLTTLSGKEWLAAYRARAASR